MNIAIANNGSNTEASWGGPPPAPHVHDDGTLPPPLKAQLEAAMCTTLPLGAADPARSFLPNDEIHRLVTPASALRTLREYVPGFPGEFRGIFAKAIFTKSPQMVKVFAILVLIGRADATREFMNNSISDGDLPLEPTVEGGTLVRSQSTPKVFDLALTGLRRDDVVAFEEMQWRVCVPIMEELGSEDEPPLFHPKTILPFVWDGPVAPMMQQGGHAKVFQVRIHPAHHRLGALEKHTRFAVKQFQSSSNNAIFKREVSALKRFSDAPNVVPLLTAFKHGSTPYLVLPWAGKDLQSLLTQTDAPEGEEHATLTLKQMLGVAEALKAIHYWRVKKRSKAAGSSAGGAVPAVQAYHGDLKPENILVTNDGWKLADFGLSSVRQQPKTGAAVTEQRPLGCSPTYRAPEHDAGPFDGQKADMWSLGCVMSVAATWMALGKKGVRAFRAKRALAGDVASRKNGTVVDDFFFEASDKKGSGFRVKPAVTHWIDKLHQAPTASPLMHDFLDLIKNDMLEVDGEKRIATDKLVDRLREIDRKCSDVPGYARPDPRAAEKAVGSKTLDVDVPRSISVAKKAVVPKKFDMEVPRSISVNMMRLPHQDPLTYANGGGWLDDMQNLDLQTLDPGVNERSSTWSPKEQLPTYEQSFDHPSLPFGSDNLASPYPVSHTVPVASPKSRRSKRQLDVDSKLPGQSKRHKTGSAISKRSTTRVARNATRSVTPGSPEPASRELFACPYFKHDPDKYCTNEWKSCGGTGWKIHRLKEHLKRAHLGEGHRCNCCLQRWSTLKGLSEHQRSDVRCVKQDDAGDDSLDETQWGKIQERNRGMQGAVKWVEIYKIIFPLDIVPSPYRDEPTSDLTLAEFRHFLESKMETSLQGRHRFKTGLDLLAEFEAARSLTESTSNFTVPSMTVDSGRCDTTVTVPDESPTSRNKASPMVHDFVPADIGLVMPPCMPGLQSDFSLYSPSPLDEMDVGWSAQAFMPSSDVAGFDPAALYPGSCADPGVTGL